MNTIGNLVFGGICLSALNGCSVLVAGVVGAAVTPLIQPAVDRILVGVGLDWVDPAGTAAVKQPAPSDPK